MAEQAPPLPNIEPGEFIDENEQTEFMGVLHHIQRMLGQLEQFGINMQAPFMVAGDQVIGNPGPPRNPYNTLPNVQNSAIFRALLRKFLVQSGAFMAEFREFDRKLRTSRNLRDEYRRNRTHAANIFLRYQTIAVLRHNYLPILAQRLFPEQIPNGPNEQVEAHIKGIYASHLSFVLDDYMSRFTKRGNQVSQEEDELRQAAFRATLQLVMNEGGDDARMRKIYERLREYEIESGIIQRIRAADPHPNIIRYYVCPHPLTSIWQ